MSENPKEAEGRKKSQLHLIPPRVLPEIAKAFECGAEKYGPHNWAKTGVMASTYKSATDRHSVEWWSGSDADAETGAHPLAHLIAGAMIALDCYLRGNLEDDRPG